MRSTTIVVIAALAVASQAGAQQAPSATDSVPAALIAEGKKVFEGKSGGALCFSCHGMNAKGFPGVGPDLTDGKWLHGDGSLAFVEALVKTGVPKPKQSPAPMLPMGGAQLSEAQVKAVAAYVWSLNRR